jgi:hypothetical protein
MAKYFIVSNSFAAPIVSDTAYGYEEGHNARDALERFAAKYSHPMGLYSASAYSSADSYHQKQEPLAKWLSNQARDPKAGGIV